MALHGFGVGFGARTSRSNCSTSAGDLPEGRLECRRRARHERRGRGGAGDDIAALVKLDDVAAGADHIHEVAAIGVGSDVAAAIARRHRDHFRIRRREVWRAGRLVVGGAEKNHPLIVRAADDGVEKIALPFAAEAEVDHGRAGLDGRVDAPGDVEGRCRLFAAVNVHGQNPHRGGRVPLGLRQARQDGFRHGCAVGRGILGRAGLARYGEWAEEEIADRRALRLHSRVDQPGQRAICPSFLRVRATIFFSVPTGSMTFDQAQRSRRVACASG